MTTILQLALLSSLIYWSLQEYYTPNFAIHQAGNNHTLSNEHTEIWLKKKSFSISFSSMAYDKKKETYYATQIALSSDKETLTRIKVGAKKDDINFLQSGTGLAARGLYETFYLANEENYQHHYVIYQEGEDGEKRAEYLSEQEGLFRLKCPINTLNINEIDYKIEDTNLSELYLILFNDANLNKTLDHGEFRD